MLIEKKNLKEKIRKAQEGDEKIVKAVEKLKQSVWRKVKDSRIGRKKLLVVRNDKGSREIHEQMQYMSEKQELCKGSSRKANTKYDPRKTMEIYQYRLYHQVTTGPEI